MNIHASTRAVAGVMQTILKHLGNLVQALELIGIDRVTAMRIIAGASRKQENFRTGARLALEFANRSGVDEGLSDVDPDFSAEWTEEIERISDAHLQSIWAALLAGSPSQPGGRPRKPVINFLRQFDGYVAEEFYEFLKVFQAMTWLVQGVASNYSPFGKAMDLGILLSIKAIDQGVEKTLKFEGLGTIKGCAGFDDVSLFAVLRLSRLGAELVGSLAGAIAFELDAEQVYNARIDNIKRIAMDQKCAIYSFKNPSLIFFHLLQRPDLQSDVKSVLEAISVNPEIDDGWKRVLAKLAEDRILVMP